MKKLFVYVLVLTMAACLLGGCWEQPETPTLPDQGTTQPTQDTPVTQTPTEPASEPEETTEPQQSAYLEAIRRADQSIFDGPSYDHKWAGTVEEAGTYTIVEEKTDDEGNLWGRLKSGAGWVDLTDIRSFDPEKTPVSGNFADARLLASGDYEHCIADTSEYMVQLAFRFYTVVYDFSLTSLQLGDDGFEVEEAYFMLPEMTPERPLVADLVFPGAMGAYGISFKDAGGNMYHYVVSLSGRNGTVVLFPQTDETP